MKITKSKKTKQNTFIALAAILIVGLAGASAAYHFKFGPFKIELDKNINLSEPSKDQLKAGAETKQQTVDLDANKDQTGSDPAPNPQPIENSNKKSVHAEITAANQDSTALHVRTLIQTIASAGNCTLTMIGPENKTYTATATIQPLPSSSTCKGFDIPLDKLAPGAWVIKIEFANDELTASTSKKVIVE